jgi:hypothetical protein
MNIRAMILAVVSFSGTCLSAQQATHPELALKIVVDKDSYTLKEEPIVKAELKNLTSKTLCFPEPDLECSTAEIGWVVISGNAVKTGEGEKFICHADGRGAVGAELDSDVKDRWIKLSPNAVYLTHATKAKARLSEAGDWRLTASYHPPEGSFSEKYQKVLRSAAKKAGCELPESIVVAEPKIVSVHSADTDR